MKAGLVKQWSEQNCAKATRPEVVLVSADSAAAGALMSKRGRVSAFVDGGGALANLNEVEGNIFISVGKPLNKNMYGIVFLNENVKLGEALKKALDELIADGTYVQLMHKWGLPVEDSTIGQASSINAGWSLPR